MAWPQPTDYNEAIQNPELCFSDAELRQGQPQVNALGLPMPCTGNFADVYRVNCPASGQNWAVKCFTRQVPGLQQRYQAISTHLEQAKLPFTVEFRYLEQGIRIRGQWYPVLKMRWIEGLTLNAFVEKYLDRPPILNELCKLWLRLADRLHRTQVAHGDLQHGNVLLVELGKAGSLGLRLIDYDGMHVPALAASASGELGHACYQHPQRLRDGTWDPSIDRFAHLVIYGALRGLIVNGRPLWKHYDNGDNLLFRQADFETPAGSTLLRELWQLNDSTVRMVVGRLILASQEPLGRVPFLNDMVTDGKVIPLTPAQERQVQTLLDGGKGPTRTNPTTVTAPPSQPAPSGGEIPWWASTESVVQPAPAPTSTASSPANWWQAPAAARCPHCNRPYPPGKTNCSYCDPVAKGSASLSSAGASSPPLAQPKAPLPAAAPPLAAGAGGQAGSSPGFKVLTQVGSAATPSGAGPAPRSGDRTIPCPQCGARIHIGASFCLSCGTVRPEQMKGMLIAALVLLIPGLAGVLWAQAVGWRLAAYLPFALALVLFVVAGYGLAAAARIRRLRQRGQPLPPTVVNWEDTLAGSTFCLTLAAAALDALCHVESLGWKVLLAFCAAALFLIAALVLAYAWHESRRPP